MNDADSDKLKLNIGDTLQLQYVTNDNKGRHYARIIGYLPGQSVIITTPRTDGKVMLIREGQVFVIRLLSGNAVYGFTSTVLRSNSRPYPYMHLSYPTEIESIVVRHSQRVGVRLVTTIQNEEPEKSFAKPKIGIIVDLSTGGAMLSTSEKIGDIEDNLTLSMRLSVGGAEHFVAIPAKIRRLEKKTDEKPDSKQKSSYLYGVQFHLLDDQEKLILHGHVYESLMK